MRILDLYVVISKHIEEGDHHIQDVDHMCCYGWGITLLLSIVSIVVLETNITTIVYREGGHEYSLNRVMALLPVTPEGKALEILKKPSSPQQNI